MALKLVTPENGGNPFDGDEVLERSKGSFKKFIIIGFASDDGVFQFDASNNMTNETAIAAAMMLVTSISSEVGRA